MKKLAEGVKKKRVYKMILSLSCLVTSLKKLCWTVIQLTGRVFFLVFWVERGGTYCPPQHIAAVRTTRKHGVFPVEVGVRKKMAPHTERQPLGKRGNNLDVD